MTEMITVYSENHMKQTVTLCGQNTVFMQVKAVYTYKFFKYYILSLSLVLYE